MGFLFSKQKIQEYSEYPDILFPDIAPSDIMSGSSNTDWDINEKDINEEDQKIAEMEKDANETWRQAKQWEQDFYELEGKISKFVPELRSNPIKHEEASQLRKNLARLRDMRAIVIQQDRMLHKRMEELIIGIECESRSQAVDHALLVLKKELDPNARCEESLQDNGNVLVTMDNYEVFIKLIFWKHY